VSFKRTASVVVLIGVAALLLYPFPIETEDRLVRVLWNFAHVPAFALMAVFLLTIPAEDRYSGRRFLYVSAVLLFAAPAIEGLQALTGRDPDFGDVLMGWAGAMIGLLWQYARHRPSPVNGRLRVCAVVIVGLTIVPVVAVLADRWAAARAFPVLADFESPLELTRWRVNHGRRERVERHATRGNRALRVVLKPGVRYARIFMVDVPGDWRPAKHLLLDVYLEAEQPVDIWFRVDDREDPPYEERFQKHTRLKPGSHELALDMSEWITPSGRPLDIGNIVRWGLFVTEPDEEVTVYMDHVRLAF